LFKHLIFFLIFLKFWSNVSSHFTNRLSQEVFGSRLAALNNDHDKRLFLAAGAAAGIACAFRAPIGGVIFALEEAISHFDANLIVRTCVCTCLHVLLAHDQQ
jgi:H+/Cl- antiporter ClcA